MEEALWKTFSLVCGQNPEGSWNTGSSLLPLCQRCTGLYTGAMVGLFLHWFLKPYASGRFIAAHGFLLFVAALFGFRVIPDGPILRTMTGIMAGFGIGTFLWVAPASALKRAPAAAVPSAQAWYGLGLAVTMGLTPLTALFCGKVGGWILQGLAFAGLVMLVGLLAWNAALGLRGCFRHFRKAGRT